MSDRVLVVLVCIASAASCYLADAGETPSPYAGWKHGPPADPTFFPIAVWLQDPKNAPKYRDAGINTYVGLWKGPTEEQLAELKKHGMKVICDQNPVGLAHKDEDLIVAWMHGDEPDNAQALEKGKGYGPPVKPEKILEDYRKLKANDPNRPVLLNLGQGVAWDGWHGRGVRTNHPEDYPEYVKGCDLASFDIYPACHESPQVQGKLWFVAQGVERLRAASKDQKVVWTCIECTCIGNPGHKATPKQVRCEVWMALVAGSRGLIYFCHQFKPKFIEAGLLAEPEILAEVTRTNRQILELAPVLNSATVVDGAQVQSADKDQPVAVMVKRYKGATYLFAVGMRGGRTEATFAINGLKGVKRAEVLGEQRNLDVKDGGFRDVFEPWDVHLYRIQGP